MNAWGWTFLLSNLVYWAMFLKVARAGSRRPLPIVVGVIHMLFAALVSVAPVRSLFDPDYIGFGLGLLRFDGRAAALPALVILGGALASAWIVVSRVPGRGLLLVAAFDLMFALNSAAATLSPGSDHRIQFGDGLTIDGLWAVSIMLCLFAAAPLLSSAWAWRWHRRPSAT
jgi:hypothetical protein